MAVPSLPAMPAEEEEEEKAINFVGKNAGKRKMQSRGKFAKLKQNTSFSIK